MSDRDRRATLRIGVRFGEDRASWTVSTFVVGDCDNEDDILGYRDGNYYHKWASIQIVGPDVPIVLDRLSKERGMTKDEIVDELLGYATEMVADIEFVMMDREFDSDPVKAICEEHGVYYLNSTSEI